MTTKEFKGFTKTSSTFGAWRQVAKVINFSTLFGAQAPTLALQLENAGYTEQEALEYIRILGKEAELEALVKSKRMGPKPMPRNKVLFLEAANLMLEAYYKAYPGVKIRSEREIKNAWEKGYSRCWGGPVRHLAELRYMKRNSKGEILGKHTGLYKYTIGQRKGLGISYKAPLFVIGFNSDKNEVIVGEENELFTKVAYVEDINLLLFDEIKEEIEVDVKTRYSANVANATIIQENDKIKITFKEPQRAITPGQSAVFYIGDIVVGGGKLI